MFSNVDDFLINGLQPVTIGNRDASNEAVSCPICYETYIEDSQNLTRQKAAMQIMECKHVFCFECITTHVGAHQQQNSNTCPICRSKLFERDAQLIQQPILVPVPVPQEFVLAQQEYGHELEAIPEIAHALAALQDACFGYIDAQPPDTDLTSSVVIQDMMRDESVRGAVVQLRYTVVSAFPNLHAPPMGLPSLGDEDDYPDLVDANGEIHVDSLQADDAIPELIDAEGQAHQTIGGAEDDGDHDLPDLIDSEDLDDDEDDDGQEIFGYEDDQESNSDHEENGGSDSEKDD